MILAVFNWSVVIGLGITLGVYLLALVVFSIVKKVVHKKKFLKEQKKKQEVPGVNVETIKVDNDESKNQD